MEIARGKAREKQRAMPRRPRSTASNPRSWSLQRESLINGRVLIMRKENLKRRFTVLRFENDLCSSSFERLFQWRIVAFEEREEEIKESEGSYRSHPPFQSSENQKLHTSNAIRIEDDSFFALFQVSKPNHNKQTIDLMYKKEQSFMWRNSHGNQIEKMKPSSS